MKNIVIGIIQENREMSEALLRLRACKDAIDVNRLGLITLNKPPYITGLMYRECVRFTAAQCLLDGIAATEEGLCIRTLNPKKDLLWGNDEERFGTASDEWRQPPLRIRNALVAPGQTGPKVFADGYAREKEGISSFEQGNMFIAYRTNRDTDNDRKVITILGVQNVNPDDECWVQRVEFWRSNVQVGTELDLTLIKSRGVVFTQIPYMYRKGDNMNLKFFLKERYEGKHDNLVLVGIVGEMLGANFNGSRY